VAAGEHKPNAGVCQTNSLPRFFGSRSLGFLVAKQLNSTPVVPVDALLKNPGALGTADVKLAEITEALPHLPPPAIEIILQTVRAFRG
jgi:hypothetical protein